MWFRRARALMAVVVATLIVAGLPSHAQQRIVIQRGNLTESAEPPADNRPFLMRLFGLGRPEPEVPLEPRARIIKVPPAGQRKATAAAPAAIVKPQNPKQDDARVVLIIGDRLAADLGRGPRRRLRRSAGCARRNQDHRRRRPRLHRGHRLEGFPRKAPLGQTTADRRGRHDRPGRRAADRVARPGGRLSLGDWETIYKARLNELMRVTREHAVPFQWVGLVPVASPQDTNDITYIDGVIRDEASEKGAPYVDVWEPFSQNGAFVASGPDLDGQVRQLRLKDGIGFTRSGARKLAFYVQQSLAGAVDVAAPTANLMQQVSGGGLVMLLNDPGAAGEDRLITAADLTPPKPGTPLHRLVVEGLPLDPVPGRYDATALR